MTDRRMISTNIFECSIAYRLGSIHPDLMGVAAQRVFMALILLADDYGNGRYIPANIRVRAFAATPQALNEITDENVVTWIEVMVEEGAVSLYEVDGQKYYSLTGWDHYQRGNWRPRKSNIPKPNGKVSDTLRNKSPNKSGHKSEDTWRNEEKGREKKGKEENRKEKKTLTPEITDFVDELFPESDYKWTEPQRWRQYDALDKLIRIDGKPKTEVFKVLKWMRDDTEPRGKFPGWSAVFRSIVRLRDNGCEKYNNALGQYRANLNSIDPKDRPTLGFAD